MASDLWTYPEQVRRGRAGIGAEVEELDLTKFSAEATDGDVGKVDSASYEPGASFIVVDTGPLVLGKKVLVPAGLVRSIDDVGQTVEIDLAKDQVENAPGVDEERIRDESYRAELSRYYTDVSR
ncbi:MAG TPA: hypothetical protein VHF67_12575 [Gaiellaceae bacterium]|jgi:hypothetical protein|nr:hypothetical protein [Gaiellaceae bacterium]